MILCFAICQTITRCHYATDLRRTQASNHHPAPLDIHRQSPEPPIVVLLELDLQMAKQRMTQTVEEPQTDMPPQALQYQSVRQELLLIHRLPPSVSRPPPTNAPPSQQSMPWLAERRHMAVRLRRKVPELRHNQLEANILRERCILLDLLQTTQLLRPLKDSDLDLLVEDHLVRQLSMSTRSTLWSHSISCSTPSWTRCS